MGLTALPAPLSRSSPVCPWAVGPYLAFTRRSATYVVNTPPPPAPPEPPRRPHVRRSISEGETHIIAFFICMPMAGVTLNRFCISELAAS